MNHVQVTNSLFKMGYVVEYSHGCNLNSDMVYPGDRSKSCLLSFHFRLIAPCPDDLQWIIHYKLRFKTWASNKVRNFYPPWGCGDEDDGMDAGDIHGDLRI